MEHQFEKYSSILNIDIEKPNAKAFYEEVIEKLKQEYKKNTNSKINNNNV